MLLSLCVCTIVFTSPSIYHGMHGSRRFSRDCSHPYKNKHWTLVNSLVHLFGWPFHMLFRLNTTPKGCITTLTRLRNHTGKLICFFDIVSSSPNGCRSDRQLTLLKRHGIISVENIISALMFLVHKYVKV